VSDMKHQAWKMDHAVVARRLCDDATNMPEEYSADFAQWCDDNLPIIREFCRQALRVARHGRTHYSARTIIEVIRHESALAEVGSAAADWKINNNRAPDLARAFMRVSGLALFETRGR
jgi:hypothetical protein